MNATPYIGGKSGSGTYQTIINQIPEHKHYIEAFAGMAGVYRHMNTAATCLLIEKDPLLFPTYHEAGFKETTSVFSYAINRIGNSRFCINDDAILLLAEYREKLDTEGTFIYLDPPYPLDSRKSGPKYRYELTDEQHTELLAVAKSYQHASIAITTYPNELYAQALKDWRWVVFDSQTRRGKAVEWLLMNYPEPTTLQDAQYLGADYRERERITRMQRRWKQKFNRLPERERVAMLQHLQS